MLTCFHLIESVSIPKGVVMTDKGTADYTQYTAFIDLSKTQYYFRTYDNSQIITVKMPTSCDCTAKILSLGKLESPQIFHNLKGTSI
ncbi:linear amide C-N hydrolase [Blautia pseudococcoides]|uniref:linear amide C-N hydrolase n=1 Tax=Blautia pseudococcoides TaxID=1796616 RepID=UPI001FA9295A|nr:linear amide C-N hydrolase [Blautia pseudococcoides]MCR2018558.1 linear amide C-N hydrolase [Blautia pseudococcoides]